MLHFHGTPITPKAELLTLAGRNFCVSYADSRDVRTCHAIGQSVMLDNGAFTFWNKKATPNWPGFMDFAEEWLEYPTTWAVIPDVIDGTEEENDLLLASWFQRRLPKGAPVWHMHEPLDRLRYLALAYDRICFGSSGEYATVGNDSWHRRAEQAFNAISNGAGRIDTWVHMLRGMSLSGSRYPFGSVDSTDVAQNHHLIHKTARRIADRWDGLQCPALWTYVPEHEQMEVA